MPVPHQIAGYEVITTLGYGARSQIYAVRDEEGGRFALKRVEMHHKKDRRILEQAIREHEVASRFEHHALRRSFRLIRRRRFFRLHEVYVVLEYVDGLTLEQRPPADHVELCHICRQICRGLHSMHRAGYTHADIKPNNVLVSRRLRAKIIDFGQSCPTGTVKPRIQGTPDYIAPEQVRREPIGPHTDIFNLGATMYWLLTGTFIPTLMPRRTALTTRKRVHLEQATPPEDVRSDIPSALSKLVMDCLREHPADRPESMRYLFRRLGLVMKQIRGDHPDGGEERRAV